MRFPTAASFLPLALALLTPSCDGGADDVEPTCDNPREFFETCVGGVEEGDLPRLIGTWEPLIIHDGSGGCTPNAEGAGSLDDFEYLPLEIFADGSYVRGSRLRGDTLFDRGRYTFEDFEFGPVLAAEDSGRHGRRVIAGELCGDYLIDIDRGVADDNVIVYARR